MRLTNGKKMRKRELFGNGKMHLVDIFVKSRSIR